MTIGVIIEHPDYNSRREELQELVKKACKTVWRHEKMPAATSVTCVLSTDKRVQDLNHDFRGKNKTTNVLSFHAGDPDYLGDIVLSADTVAKEAKEQRKKFEAHLVHLVVHACLHLLGYDHEKDEDAERMERKEIAILHKLGLKNPYL